MIIRQLYRLICGMLFVTLLFCSCGHEDDLLPSDSPGEPSSSVPEGYFIAHFHAPQIPPSGRAPISGQDNRVSHLRYLVYKSSGEFVKERVLHNPSLGIANWPLAAVRDTLPVGTYRAVFLGNVDNSLFAQDAPDTASDVLQNYTNSYADARIVLPPCEFSGTTEYYWANVTFSDANPDPSVLLQRIIGTTQLHRNFIDAQDALNQLTNNIFEGVGYETILTDLVGSILPGLLRSKLLGSILLGLDTIVNFVVRTLVKPITDALHDLLIQSLIDKLGVILTGNPDAGVNDVLAFLSSTLNPWNHSDAHAAVVTINNFPKAVNLDLQVTDHFEGLHRFCYAFQTSDADGHHYFLIKGFDADYDIRRIDVIGAGLNPGLIVEGVIDHLLLPGAFMHIDLPLMVDDPKTNWLHQADYSFLDLSLRSYAQQDHDDYSITLSISLGEVGVLGDLLGGLKDIPLVGHLLDAVLGLITDIEISVPLKLPLLSIENLSLSGGWSKN